jgi:hypothetical protein
MDIGGIQAQIQSLSQSIMGLANVPFGPQDVNQAVTELIMLKEQMASMNDQVVGYINQQIAQLETQNTAQEQAEPNLMANSKKIVKGFNLKKAQEQPYAFDDMALNDTPEMMGDQVDQQVDAFSNNPMFQDGGDLKDWMDQNDYIGSKQFLLSYIEDPMAQQMVEDALDAYYESELEENDKIKIAASIFDALPDMIKTKPENVVMGIPAQAFTDKVNNIIKEAAEKSVKKEVKSFNLEKTAQAKTLDNVIMYGPEQTRMDPFSRQPVSDWHIVERNKGFGLTVGDIWNIDWESIWRSTVMDKYSRAYRDKDGNWVGGYINKRFEVDYNVPPASNMQLKPGQLRKPILPEYGNTESRLQAARANGDVEGGPVVCDVDPYNWKEASSKKKVK